MTEGRPWAQRFGVFVSFQHDTRTSHCCGVNGSPNLIEPWKWIIQLKNRLNVKNFVQWVVIKKNYHDKLRSRWHRWSWTAKVSSRRWLDLPKLRVTISSLKFRASRCRSRTIFSRGNEAPRESTKFCHFVAISLDRIASKVCDLWATAHSPLKENRRFWLDVSMQSIRTADSSTALCTLQIYFFFFNSSIEFPNGKISKKCETGQFFCTS